MREQDAFVAGLRQRLLETTREMGVSIEDVQILRIRPADPEVLARMGAASSEEIREQASRVRLETEERIRRRQIESTTELATLQSEHDHTGRMRALELSHDRDLTEERASRALSSRQREREAEELAARLDARRAEAGAERDAELIVSSAQEQKSPAMRDHELALLTTEKIADALSSLREARWVSVGADSPVSGLAALVAGAQGILAGGRAGEKSPH